MPLVCFVLKWFKRWPQTTSVLFYTFIIDYNSKNFTLNIIKKL